MKQTFIAGPCVIESAELLDTVAAKLVEINKKLGTDIILRPHLTRLTVPLYIHSVVLALIMAYSC